jgi:hypothetical protein
MNNSTEEAPEFYLFEEEPTDKEIEFFAKKLGMHPIRDKNFLYLAREGKRD